MIIRDYLPFKSARQYCDRGMAKWMGFFISEHSSALSKLNIPIQKVDTMEEEDKLCLISQAYLSRVNVELILSSNQNVLSGTISDITQNKLILKTQEKYHHIRFQDIIKIRLIKETDYE